MNKLTPAACRDLAERLQGHITGAEICEAVSALGQFASALDGDIGPGDDPALFSRPSRATKPVAMGTRQAAAVAAARLIILEAPNSKHVERHLATAILRADEAERQALSIAAPAWLPLDEHARSGAPVLALNEHLRQIQHVRFMPPDEGADDPMVQDGGWVDCITGGAGYWNPRYFTLYQPMPGLPWRLTPLGSFNE